MNYTNFIFALFVFALFCLSVQVFAKKKGKQVSQKEQRLLQLYENLEEMMDDMEEYVRSAKEDLARDRVQMADMMTELEQLKKQVKSQKQEQQQVFQVLSQTEPQAPRKRGRPRKYPLPTVVAKTEPTKPVLVKSKHELVNELVAQGYMEEGIAKQLGISKGEVALIMGLRKLG